MPHNWCLWVIFIHFHSLSRVRYEQGCRFLYQHILLEIVFIPFICMKIYSFKTFLYFLYEHYEFRSLLSLKPVQWHFKKRKKPCTQIMSDMKINTPFPYLDEKCDHIIHVTFLIVIKKPIIVSHAFLILIKSFSFSLDGTIKIKEIQESFICIWHSLSNSISFLFVFFWNSFLSSMLVEVFTKSGLPHLCAIDALAGFHLVSVFAYYHDSTFLLPCLFEFPLHDRSMDVFRFISFNQILRQNVSKLFRPINIPSSTMIIVKGYTLMPKIVGDVPFASLLEFDMSQSISTLI